MVNNWQEPPGRVFYLFPYQIAKPAKSKQSLPVPPSLLFCVPDSGIASLFPLLCWHFCGCVRAGAMHMGKQFVWASQERSEGWENPPSVFLSPQNSSCSVCSLPAHGNRP